MNTEMDLSKSSTESDGEKPPLTDVSTPPTPPSSDAHPLPIPPSSSPKLESLPPPCPFTSFVVPRRAIFQPADIEMFRKSRCFAELIDFVQSCAEAVIGVKISDNYPVSTHVLKFEAFMGRLGDLVDEIPPLKQPMRFGNKAFRQWHTRLSEIVPEFLRSLLPLNLVELGACEELSPYFCSSFGNETRIDYGTGHEMTFAVALLCLKKLGIFQKEDLPAVVLRCFVAYIKTMRKLQTVYVLEPAGSHGVWGLDDYHCLTFLWGAAQLSSNNSTAGSSGENAIISRPSSIHDASILQEFSGEYLYFENIAAIRRMKSGAPFAETSPMLNDISSMSEWAKVLTGMMRLFQGEVLLKFPVSQHLLFGNIFKCDWESSPMPQGGVGGGAVGIGGGNGMMSVAPWMRR